MNEAVTAYWSEHYLNREVDLCSLCANTGKIDTQPTAFSPSGARAGRINYCICPNGQAMREAVSRKYPKE